MADSLNEIKESLIKAFNAFSEKANTHLGRGNNDTASELLMAASEAAKALALIERELREAKQSGYGKLEKN